MFRFKAAAVGLTLALGLCGAAQAGVYADDLSKCLVKSATPADQSLFMVWMFSALSLHPDVKAFTNLTDAKRDAISKDTANLLGRLMTVDCRKETVAAIKYEGPQAIEVGFRVFGEAAGRGLFNSPEVAASLAKMGTYFDSSKIEALGVEAGIPPKAADKAK